MEGIDGILISMTYYVEIHLKYCRCELSICLSLWIMNMSMMDVILLA